MNKLRSEKQEAVISALVEGASIRSAERMSGVHRDTIMRLMLRIGNACETLMDVAMRDLPCRHIQVDEVWSYVGKKQRHVLSTDNPNKVGDFWTWVALDSDTKLVPTYKVGKRDSATAHAFIFDLSSRLANRIQISSDALNLYVEAVDAAFGLDVDYAQIVKSYEAEPIGPGRYSPPKVVATEKKYISGSPDLAQVSTSYIERQNLTMRMSMRRLTRLTNGFSKKLENLKAAVAVHFAHYNFIRIHRSLKVTPALEAGVTDRIWTIRDIVELAND
ncbi:MAG: IS1 family transposase [bacterium]